MKQASILACAALSAVCSAASVAFTAGVTGDESSPIFGTKMPTGYRDWPLISVAHEEGDLNDIRAILGNNAAIEAFRGGEAFVPGWRDHCPARLELRPV